MDAGPTFEAVKADVESSYPTPVAAVFRRCRVTGEEDLGGRHKSLIDLFEVLIKFLCTAGLQEARKFIPNLKDRLPQKEKSLEFLKRPSLGGWVGLLRILCGLKPGAAEPKWLPRIAEWYGQAKTPENSAALALLGGIEGLSYEKRTKTPNAEICNALVTYRNKQLAHAASIREQELARRLPILDGVLAHLLRSASFLGEMTAFHTERVEVAANGMWKVHAARLVGASEEPASYTCQEKLELSEVYLADPTDGALEGAPVPLSPFILWQMNEELKRPEAYFYNDAWRTKLEYLSYTSGSYYYHKELHSDFSDLIQLKLRPGVEEDAYRFMPAEERAERAEELYKRAMVLVKQRRYEDALETLEKSAEYERRADTFLEMAKVQRELGDPDEAVRQTIQSCLDLDASNDEALSLLAGKAGDAAKPEARVGAPSETARRATMTFLEAVAPAFIREYALLGWLGLIVAWYGLSGFLEYGAGYPGIFLVFPSFVACTALIAIIPVAGKASVRRLELPLSLQLDSMRLERFEAWFRDQQTFIFGSFEVRGGRLRLLESVASDWPRYLAYAAPTVLAFTGAFFLSNSHAMPPIFMLKRCVDFLLLYCFAGPMVWYVVCSTIFVYRYTRLSLKPMLTRINDDGLRAFGPLLTTNIVLAALLYVVYWVAASEMVRIEQLADLPFLAVATAVFMVWSLGLPMMIRRAAREAKCKSVHAYSAHIEQAFRAFLDDPDEEKLQRYQWLAKNQKVISRIPTWPLSWKETAFGVLGSNLLLLAVDAWYVAVRTGRWPAVADWIRGLL